jgi:hypothetical protein
MPKFTKDQLDRLKWLLELPDGAHIPTSDAALLRGIGLSTWQRHKALGLTPRVYRTDGSTHRYLVGDVRQMPTPEEEIRAQAVISAALAAAKAKRAARREATTRDKSKTAELSAA